MLSATLLKDGVGACGVRIDDDGQIFGHNDHLSPARDQPLRLLRVLPEELFCRRARIGHALAYIRCNQSYAHLGSRLSAAQAHGTKDQNRSNHAQRGSEHAPGPRPFRSPQMNRQRQPRRKQHQHKSHTPRPGQRRQLQKRQKVQLRVRDRPAAAVRPEQVPHEFKRHPQRRQRQPCTPHRSAAGERAHQQHAQSKHQRGQAHISEPHHRRRSQRAKVAPEIQTSDQHCPQTPPDPHATHELRSAYSSTGSGASHISGQRGSRPFPKNTSSAVPRSPATPLSLPATYRRIPWKYLRNAR